MFVYLLILLKNVPISHGKNTVVPDARIARRQLAAGHFLSGKVGAGEMIYTKMSCL